MVTKRPKVQGRERWEVNCSEVKWSDVKWRVSEAWWRNVQKYRDVKNGDWSVVKCSAVKWSEVMVLSDMCVLSLIYSYVALCRFCAVRCLIIIGFDFYSLIIRLVMFNILFMFFALYFCILRFCIALCIISPIVYSCLFPICVQVYRPQPPAGNQIAVNK